jgi:hypothetical protein
MAHIFVAGKNLVTNTAYADRFVDLRDAEANEPTGGRAML